LLVTATFLLPSAAQNSSQITVKGTVTDNRGEAIIGASVTIKGRSIGVVTDVNGNYDIQVSSDETLIFSSLGMDDMEEPINGRSSINVSMQEGAKTMDEVVVVGYGTMRKSDVTGAVASVKGDDLKKSPSANLTQALQGRAAGVTVNANSGQPGAAATVRIRGIGTLNNSDPIYVVDGIILSNIDFLNSNDIESTELLKDASAAAIYGSRGANGVIIITTKKGTQQKGKISIDAYAGIQSRWRKLDVMQAREFAKTLVNLGEVVSEMNIFNTRGFNTWLRAYRLGTSSYYPTATSFNYSKQETDWQDEVFVKNAPIQSYNVSFDGGDETKQYAFSAGYFDQQGTIIGSYYKRLTIRANTSYKIRKWLTVGENITYMWSTYRNAPNNSGSAGASVLTAALAMAPWDPTHYPDGSINNAGKDLSGQPSAASNFKNVTNPFSMVEMNHPMDYTDRVVGDVYLDLNPIKGLSIRSSVSLDFSLLRNRSFGDAYEFSSYDKRQENFVSSGLSRYYTIANQNIITYSKDIKKHSFSVMAGHTLEEYNYYNVGVFGSVILVPEPENWYVSQTTKYDTANPPGDGVDRTRMVSFLGRFHYAYDNRYLITVNFRADGSSKFPRHRWGYFPSAAIGWRISQEKFMEDVRGLDELKLRIGWGQLGNQNSVGSSAFIQGINSGMYFSGYVFGQNGVYVQKNGSIADGQNSLYGASVNTWVNLDGRWEVTEQWNAAVDWAVLRNRLSGTVDAFRRTTKDMFLSIIAPAYTGNLFAPLANVGSVRNDGIELQLQWQDSKNKFHYSIGGNISFIKNELIKLNGGYPVYGDRVISDIGLGLYTYYGYEYLGMYKTDAEANEYLHAETPGTYRAGDAKYLDLNGDGKINDDDRKPLGNPFPWLSYGINASFEYFGFDLQIFMQGVYGNELYNAQRHQLEGAGNESIMSTVMRDAWTPSTPNGTIPNPRNAVNFYTSSRFIESGAYFRLKNLQLGYTLPQNITRKAHIDRLRFYASASNLFTITKYSGYDPEVGSGVDYGNYPQARTFLFGLNLDF
jgi:TonB-linked SusC/RagA family outer membrane protein